MSGGGKNIHMLHKLVGPTNVYQLGKANLGDDGTELARGSWDTVCGGTVTSGEDFSRNNEGGNVGAKVLEIIGEAVKNDESFGSRWCGGKLVITESCEFIVRKWKKKVKHLMEHTHNNKENGKHSEAHELDGLATPRVDEQEWRPVSRNETASRKDKVTNASVVDAVVNPLDTFGWGSSKSDGSKHNGIIKTETVESDL